MPLTAKEKNKMSECTHDCSTCTSKCEKSESLLEKPSKYSDIKKVIAVVSGKGGVGKSLTTAMLAGEANRQGLRTAVLDADLTGPSIPKIFGVDEKATGDEEGIDPVMTRNGIKIMSVNLLLEDTGAPVIWRGPVIAGVVKQFWTDVKWGDIDIMFIDCPPGTGDVPITVFQSIPVKGIVVVTSPQELVSVIVEKAVNMAKMMNISVLGVVQNMSYYECENCGKKHYIFGESKVAETAKEFEIKHYCEMPIIPEAAAKCDEGKAEEIETEEMKEFFNAVMKD